MKRIGIIVTLLLVVLISGCSTPKEQVEEVPQETIAIESDAPEPSEEVVLPYQGALTGIGAANAQDTRPIAILINNLAPARPQSGLSEADIIWEVLAEGGITRLVAIFQSSTLADFDIGPVRSNRPYFIELSDSYQAVITHAGASNDAYAILQKQKKPYLDEISNAGKYFWRSSERKAPHNLYTNLTKLREGIEAKGYETLRGSNVGYPFYTTEEVAAQSTGTIKNINVHFQMKNYKVSYQFNETDKTYMRSINDEAHIDKNNNEQLSATNLIFMRTTHKVLDNEGRLSVDLSSGGEAIVIQNGQAIGGSWIVDGQGMIRFQQNGEEIKLNPGQSFIHIIPNEKSINEHVSWE